jgi:hypothetical protein
MLQAFAFAFSFAFSLRLFWSVLVQEVFRKRQAEKAAQELQVLTP